MDDLDICRKCGEWAEFVSDEEGESLSQCCSAPAVVRD